MSLMKLTTFFLVPLPCGQPRGFFAGGGGSWAWALLRASRSVAASRLVAMVVRGHVSTCRNQNFISKSIFRFIFDDFTRHHLLSSFRKTAVIIIIYIYYNINV